MTLTVNGVNLVPFIAYQGLSYQLSDIDAPNSGRTLSAKMIRGRVASKVRLDVTCRPLTADEASIVLSAIYPEFVTVTYYDPYLGQDVTKKMYSNNRKAQFLHHSTSRGDLWKVDTFPLIEE